MRSSTFIYAFVCVDDNAKSYVPTDLDEILHVSRYLANLEAYRF